jgi:DNA-binding CsgD family transcriptional regulator
VARSSEATCLPDAPADAPFAASFEPLTARELDVLALLGRAASNREIASRLEISPRTVESHLSHIYGKLGVRGRGEAMLWVVHRGMHDGSRSGPQPERGRRGHPAQELVPRRERRRIVPWRTRIYQSLRRWNSGPSSGATTQSYVHLGQEDAKKVTEATSL